MKEVETKFFNTQRSLEQEKLAKEELERTLTQQLNSKDDLIKEVTS